MPALTAAESELMRVNTLAHVSRGRLYLSASHPDVVLLLDKLFPGVEWPRDRDGVPVCATGIRVRSIHFDDADDLPSPEVVPGITLADVEREIGKVRR